ncbi:MAG: esterase family protein, partial [Acidobacteriaceae bacterium]|nr:esterase family protein [Acidobacteriaceae bacterium]
MRPLLFCFILPVSALFAQQQLPRLNSPEVASDGRVTFRFRDANAQKVTVNIAGATQPLFMVKDADGIWSATSETMRPDLYSYTFNADGVTLLDPSNSALVPNLLNPSSVLHVSGSSAQPWEQTDIPHGEIHHHFYRSAIIGDNRDFFVYTPPGYNPRANTRYPVLYLLHGYSDDASAWTAVGHANLIVDSLIAAAQVKPMIIVMPLGYGEPAIVHPAPGSGSPFSNPGMREKNYSNFRAALIDEVIPMVEKNYSVTASRDARAIAGLSMGGSESLLTGLNRLDTFAWVASFSAGGLGDDLAVNFPQLSASANDKLHLLWIACGTEDRLITPNRNLVQWLKSKDIRVTAN